MLPFSSIIYAFIAALITFFILRLLQVSKTPATLIALSSPLWYGTVSRGLGQIPWEWVIGVGLLIPYTLGPLLVRALSRWPAHPEVEPYNPRDDQPPPEIGTFFEDVEQALGREGYAPEVWLLQRGMVQHTISRMRVFVNAREESAAIAYAIVSDDPRVRQFVSYVDFITYRRDGRHRLTNNAPRPSPYPPLPHRELEMFPQVRDPGRLARLHRALCSRDGRPAPLPEEFRQDPVSYASDAIRRELMCQVGTRYLALDETGDYLRPSVRGAALMTWKMLPPASWVISHLVHRRAASLLALLDRRGPDERPLTTPADRSTGSPSLLPLMSAAAVLIVVAIVRLPELFGGVSLAPPGLRDESFSLPAGFTVAGEFAEAVRQLEALAGATGDTLFTVAGDGTRAPSGGYTVPLRSTVARSFLEQVRPAFLAHGHYVIHLEKSFGIGGEPDLVAILPTPDQLEVIRLLGTRAPRASPEALPTTDIVAWLGALHAEHPFMVVGAGASWFTARLARAPRDPALLARRVHAFCPGASTVEEIARGIATRREIDCRWELP